MLFHFIIKFMRLYSFHVGWYLLQCVISSHSIYDFTKNQCVRRIGERQDLTICRKFSLSNESTFPVL